MISQSTKILFVLTATLLVTACGQTISTVPTLPTPTAYTSQPIVQTPHVTATMTMPVNGLKQYSQANVPFTFMYPQNWTVNQDAAMSVSLSSPTSVASCSKADPNFQGENMDCVPEVTITYYASVAEEPGNKLNRIGAKTLAELLDKDPELRKLGPTMLDGKSAFEVSQEGFVNVYAVYAETPAGLYSVSFNHHSTAAELSAEEKMILSSIHLLASTAAAQNSISVGASLQLTK